MTPLETKDTTKCYLETLQTFLSDSIIHTLYEECLIEIFQNNAIQQLPSDLLHFLSQLNFDDYFSILKLDYTKNDNALIHKIVKMVKEMSLFELYKYKETKSNIKPNQLKGMKLKKVHEVKQICPFIQNLWTNEHVHHIVDIGAGQGFISRFLAQEYHFNVIGVETQKQLVEKVNEQNKNMDNFHMITYNITKEMKSSELEHLVFNTNSLPEYQSKRQSLCPEYGIIGLHCCGDLSPSMCRLFVESTESCKLLCFVGCCYNLLSTKDDNPEGHFGYPLNTDMTHVPMSHYCRNAIVQNTQFNCSLDLQSCITRLFYRSLLQLWIFTYFKEESNPLQYPVGSIPFKFGITSFYDYIIAYYKRKHEDMAMPSEEKVNSFYNEYKDKLNTFTGLFVLQNIYPLTIVVLGSLINTLGQLLESVIIADRILYLQRHGTKATVHCVFDRKQSPRCMCITAIK